MTWNQETMGRGMTGLRRRFVEDFTIIRETPVLWPLALLVFVSGFVNFISLRALGVVVPVCFLFALVIFVVQTRRFPRPSTGTIVVWLVFAAIVGLAAMRSLNVDYASGRFIKLASMSLLAILLWSLSARVLALPALRSVLVVSLGFGLMWGFVEGISDGFIFELTHDVIPGEAMHAANRPIVLLVVFLWPMVLALSQVAGRRVAWFAVLLTLVSTFTTESQSAQLAILGAVTVFGWASLAPRSTLWVVGVGGVVTILGLPVGLAYFNFLPEVGDYFLPLTVVARLELWNFVAGKIMEQPLLGYGLEAGRFLLLDGMTHKYFGGPLMHHPHNAIIQIWFEMGLLGASVAALGWALLVRQIGYLSSYKRSYPLAALTCILIIGAVSHGLWQTWWVSALVVVPFFFAISLGDDHKSQN